MCWTQSTEQKFITTNDLKRVQVYSTRVDKYSDWTDNGWFPACGGCCHSGGGEADTVVHKAYGPFKRQLVSKEIALEVGYFLGRCRIHRLQPSITSCFWTHCSVLTISLILQVMPDSRAIIPANETGAMSFQFPNWVCVVQLNGRLFI